ncbi:biotin/lipoyl-binding carrier protein [Acidisphaera rubrifaciens]|uniref:Urea carboxylase n=1 Tax=Acidisphaera rubrifaciens HS-AP3 TaxID=1231350 RepID=A0A0D6P2G7_9PROT|nr:biotin/lipoyl-binding carrier protein [Acidisphaera rubrifaciens]GAN75955.1 urea carboxylase [Acidisphaera rubrifaciens HS-AP3]
MTQTRVLADVSGSVWKIEAAPGDQVAEGDTILLLESMKMEIPVPAPHAGRIAAILVEPEQAVTEGDAVALIER